MYQPPGQSSKSRMLHTPQPCSPRVQNMHLAELSGVAVRDRACERAARRLAGEERRRATDRLIALQ